MNLKDFLEIAIGLCALIGIVYKSAQAEASIYKSIDALKDETSIRLNLHENKFAIHLTEYSTRKDFIDYRIHGLEEKISHKFNRCWDEIKQIQGFLQKEGFYSREND